MTRTVLVTGGGGFVGSHVVEQLLDRTNWSLVVVDSFRHNGEFVRLLDATGRDTSRVTVLVHDLTVPFSPRAVRNLDGIDAVVNVASRSHVRESIDEPADFVLNNVKLAVTVLELARQVEPTHLIHVSTDEVHGPHPHRWPVEHRPSSPYAASKAAQADLVWSYARTYGVPTTVVASANMFGERQAATAYVPLVVRALTTGSTLYVHYDANDAPGERAYTYVRNVADRILGQLLVGCQHDVDDPVNYVALRGQRRIDNLALARLVADELDLPLLWQPQRGDVTRPGYDETYHDVGPPWDAPVDFLDGLRLTVRWFAAHPEHLDV